MAVTGLSGVESACAAGVDKRDIPTSTSGRRVLVVDDHQVFAEMLSSAVGAAPGMECVGTAFSGAQALAVAQQLRPDVVLLDLEMRGDDGTTAVQRLREVSPRSAIVAVSSEGDSSSLARTMQTGAAAFVTNSGPLAELLDLLSQVRLGSMLVAPSAFLTPSPAANTAGGPGTVTLPLESAMCWYCCAKGLRISQMTRNLSIRTHTCGGYVKSLLRKLGVGSQLEAVLKAQRLGMDTIGLEQSRDAPGRAAGATDPGVADVCNPTRRVGPAPDRRRPCRPAGRADHDITTEETARG